MSTTTPSPRDRSATIQPLAAIEASVRVRADTDVRFMSWWLYFLILSWLTLGIATIYYFVRRVSRIDNYSRRKQEFYKGVIEFTDRFTNSSDKRTVVEPIVRDMRGLIEPAIQRELRPIGALKAILLTIVTLGIYFFVVRYQVNRAWADRQRVEREFDDLLSKAWIALGITSYPVTFEPAPGKDRNFWLYLGLTFVTLGIWGLVWDYKIHTDPENIFPRIHQVEDTVIQLARAA